MANEWNRHLRFMRVVSLESQITMSIYALQPVEDVEQAGKAMAKSA